jgi:signal transduction histidine kinase
MNTVFDQRTLILLGSVFYIVLPLTVWLVLRMPRTPSPLLWCGGSLFGGVGFALMGLRGHVPDEVSYLLGQPMLILGALMAAQSLRLDLSRQWPWMNVIVALLGYTAVLAYLLETAHIPTLGVLIRSANLTAITLLVHAAWKVSRAEHSRNALTIAAAYSAQALGIAINLSSSLRGSEDIHSMLGSTLNHVAYLIMILVSLIASMGYLGLALERTAASTLMLSQDTIRREHWRDRRQALAEADRGRILSVLTESLSQSLLQPLTAASLNLQLVSRELKRRPQDRALAKHLLSQVVTDILNTNATVERIRSLVRPSVSREDVFDLVEVLQDLHQLVRTQAISQGTRLHISEELSRTNMRGDRMALTHALLQLVNNALVAVRHCKLQDIHLRVWREDEWVVVQISDSGPGFTDSFLASWSSRSVPAANSLQGIGLHVVRGIVKQHQGQISLDNEPNGGARVTLLLPQLC